MPVVEVIPVPPVPNPVAPLPSALIPVLLVKAPQFGAPHRVNPVILLKLIVCPDPAAKLIPEGKSPMFIPTETPEVPSPDSKISLLASTLITTANNELEAAVRTAPARQILKSLFIIVFLLRDGTRSLNLEVNVCSLESQAQKDGLSKNLQTL